jgi:hypothetical protein
MHEHGLMTKLLDRARREAEARKAVLRGVHARLGALYGADEAHFRHEFEHVCEELGLGVLTLEVELSPERPVGVELVRVHLASHDASESDAASETARHDATSE